MYKRIYVAFFIMTAVLGILIAKIGIINLNASFSPAANNVSSRSILLDTSRGMIYDRNMKKIVNTQTENLTVCLPSPDALKLVEKYLSDDEKQKVYNDMSKGNPCLLYLPQKFNEKLVSTASLSERYSDYQPCVHIIGHLDENGNGAMGLEKAYDNYLNLQSGTLKAVWSVDAVDNILWGNGLSFEGDNYLSPAGIQLTINLDIQKIAETALNKHQIQQGAVVILDSETNEILAMASAPLFNPRNISASVNDGDSPFLNRAITPYSVGSVFKPFVASVLIENNMDPTYNCVGKIEIGSTTFRCNNNNAHGVVNMTDAMEDSCNSYFISAGQKIGKEKLLSLCSDFGLGKSLELADNLNTRSGTLPDESSLSSPQALANLSFGQGKLLASPLQLAVAYSVFANGGYYRAPTLMKGIIDKNGNTVQKVRLPEKYRILNLSTAEKVSSTLKSVVENGNGHSAFSGLCDNRGKTATAQSGWYENGIEITHTWFCGYSTIGNKTYTIVIFKENGSSGAADCAPVFKDISEQIYGIITEKH